MKKITLLFSFIIAGIFVSNAQITISQWDVAGVGNVLYEAADTVKTLAPGSINPGPAGANQTWNFSTLLSNTVDTLTFTNPAWLPNGSSFPNANLAIISSNDSSEIYLENISTGLFIDGIYTDPFGQGAMTLVFNPAEQIAKFTATYNTTFQDTSSAQGEFLFTQFAGVDSVRFKHTVNKDVTTDGWGNVITPLGTYPCLRNRGKVITSDSIWLHVITPPMWIDAGPPYTTVDTSWHFAWWANGAGFPLVEFDSTAGDTIRNITWLKTLPFIGAVSETASSGEINVFPNPSSGKFIVQSTEFRINSMEIHNLVGEKVFQKTLHSKSESLNCDLQSQPDGVYFLHIKTDEGIVTKKLIINK